MLKVFNDFKVCGETTRWPHQLVLLPESESEPLAQLRRIRAGFPAGGNVDDEVADAELRFGFGVPQVNVDKARAGLQVDIGLRRGDFAAAFGEPEPALPVLVGRLAVREAGVAVDSEQRDAGADQRELVGALSHFDSATEWIPAQIQVWKRRSLTHSAAVCP